MTGLIEMNRKYEVQRLQNPVGPPKARSPVCAYSNLHSSVCMPTVCLIRIIRKEMILYEKKC